MFYAFSLSFSLSRIEALGNVSRYGIKTISLHKCPYKKYPYIIVSLNAVFHSSGFITVFSIQLEKESSGMRYEGLIK